jgi:mRNA interferase HicA
MKGAELIRRIRRHARKQGLPFVERRDRGKGGHVEIAVGERRTIVPTGGRELPTGTRRAILKQLGIEEDQL